MEGAKRATGDDRSWKNVPSIRRTQRFSYGNRVKKKTERSQSAKSRPGKVHKHDGVIHRRGLVTALDIQAACSSFLESIKDICSPVNRHWRRLAMLS